MIFLQMEALTGWGKKTLFLTDIMAKKFSCTVRSRFFPRQVSNIVPAWMLYIAAKDEWDFEYLGILNHPFIKASHPHHEGIWGWGNVADQMVLMIRNMRRSMVECE